MGLFDWLTTLFKRPEVRRDVSTLASDAVGDDVEAATEVVSSKKEPLKANHRRWNLRDPRLLPKPKPKPTYTWPRPKKKTYFTADDANRLFSGTLRTRNRTLRDLTTDPEQLERYGLPLWHNEEDLARALNVTVKQLRHFSIHRHRETSPHYVCFAIPKRGGGQRLIYAPKRRLKEIQRRLHVLLTARLPTSSVAHGFLPQRSVGTNAAPHVGKKFVLKLDLKDCFPSIHFGRVRGLFISFGYGYPVATVLAVLMTECPRQPVEIDGSLFHVPVGPRACVQGAPTSPSLCNAVLLRLDHRLQGLAKKFGFAYTRYADDLTFSGDDASCAKALHRLIKKIVADEGWRLNSDKTRLLRRAQRQRVAGVVVNHTLGLSRQERRKLRAAIHQFAKSGDSSSAHRLRGKVAYLRMLNAQQAAPLEAALQKALETKR